MTRRVPRSAVLVLSIIVLFVGFRFLRNRIPMWSDIEYDRYDGRVIFQSFRNNFSRILNSKFDPKRNNYLEIPQGTLKSESIPSRSTFCLIKVHYLTKIEPFWLRLSSSQARVELRGIYLVRSGLGMYLSNEVHQSKFRRGRGPGSSGFDCRDLTQDSKFNGPLFADKIGSLKKNSRIRLSEDFYFVQVYDQFRVYSVDDLPWSIRNVMKGRIQKIFEKSPNEE